jgi:pimeloyl-ACP methyl ester carboxylesterase
MLKKFSPQRSWRRAIFLLLFLSWLAACARPVSTPDPNSSTVTLEDCILSAPGTIIRLEAQCGTLTVPENRNGPNGRQITLNLAVVPAVSRSPEPDPLFLLAGGPGQAATEAFPAIGFAFERINQDREVVLVDQRGTGKSNPLRCTSEEESDLSELSLDEAEIIEKIKACPARLSADLRQYTTVIAMQDLDAVRAALGYEKINLYGASYGTRAALTYLRLYPERVRSVILDAVVNEDFLLFLNSARDGQQAINLLFERCQADAACREAFPELQAEFEGLLQELKTRPAQISLNHPLTGEPVELTLTDEDITAIVYALLYTPETAALLPLAIHAAQAEENFAPLMAQALAFDPGIYDGMFYSVACAEDAPFINAKEAEALSKETYFGDRTKSLREVCAGWPRGEVPLDFRSPISSETPVLLLSGEGDPITPPRYADQVSRMLPNSLHVVAPGMGHGILIRGCVSRLVTDFVENGSISDLDKSCVDKIEPPPFFITFNGPKP